jgi:ubiquinone/menaquinone biosynthesis C-methylase UbiE
MGFQLTGSAPERYEQFLAPIMAPFVTALLDAADLRPGADVLDVACGTGFATRAAADRVGPTGRVAGADLNPGMLQVAARQAPAIEWHEAGADRLPFADAAFDAVVCQQGLQFFPDMDGALSEAARVTRPGGRIAVTVWAPLERSPYMAAQLHGIQEVIGQEASASFTGAFRCSPERVTAALAAAGFRDVEDREVVADVRLPQAAGFVPGHLTAIPWGVAVAEARPDGLRQAARTILELLAPFTNPDGSVTAPFASLLVTATR